MRNTLTDDEMLDLDLLLSYVAESEHSDYYQRIDEGDSVEGHAYGIYIKLSKLWDQKKSEKVLDNSSKLWYNENPNKALT